MNALSALCFGIGLLFLLLSVIAYATTLGWGVFALQAVFGLGFFYAAGALWKHD